MQKRAARAGALIPNQTMISGPGPALSTMSKQAEDSPKKTPDPRFRLLAIQPHKDCGERFHKVLTPGKVYSFYQDYTFIQEDQHTKEPPGPTGKVTAIEHTSSFPEDLYDLDNVKVSLSAVVGENGSGKSTLIELLFYAVYVLSTTINKDNNQPLIARVIDRMNDKISTISNDVDNLYLKLDKERERLVEYVLDKRGDKESNVVLNKSYSLFEKAAKTKYRFDNLLNNLEELKRKVPSEKLRQDELTEGLKVSVFIEIRNKFYELSIEDGRIYLYQIVDQRVEFPIYDFRALKYLPYSIAINYSHYSLNSDVLGEWINALFHKNDAYQSPLVISPMRNKGNFNINDEQEFAKYRLLHNVLLAEIESDGKRPLTIGDSLTVSKVVFRLKKGKIAKKLEVGNGNMGSTDDRAILMLGDLIHVWFGFLSISFTSIKDEEYPFKEELLNYIVAKIDRIEEKYPFLGELNYSSNDLGAEDRNRRFYENLKNEKSHITFKIWQSLNFIVKHVDHPKSIWQNTGEKQVFTKQELMGWINLGKDELSDLMNHLPPPIFDIDFILTKDNKAEIKFSDLSSGEQQMVHSVQSMTYHLNNIESVHKAKDGNRVAYKNVNIILDEIELYFHPAWQQRYVDELLEGIKRLNLQHIKAINILFSTHSPFILSDLPKSNILYLKADKEGENKEKAKQRLREAQTQATFGANIHDLLSHSFYMNEGFMGAVAKEKIKSLIKFLSPVEETKKKGKKGQGTKKQIAYWSETKSYSFIMQIGEPMLRDSLLDLHYKKFVSNSEDDVVNDLNRKIEFLKKTVNEITKREGK